MLDGHEIRLSVFLHPPPACGPLLFDGKTEKYIQPDASFLFNAKTTSHQRHVPTILIGG